MKAIEHYLIWVNTFHFEEKMKEYEEKQKKQAALKATQKEKTKEAEPTKWAEPRMPPKEVQG